MVFGRRTDRADTAGRRPGISMVAIGMAVVIGSTVGGGVTWAAGSSHPTKVVIVPGSKHDNTVAIDKHGNDVNVAGGKVGISSSHNTVKLDPSSQATVGIDPSHSTVKVSPTSTILTSGVFDTADSQETSVPAHQRDEVDFYGTGGYSSIRVVVNAPQNGPNTPCDLSVSIQGETGFPGPNGDGIEGAMDTFNVTYAVGVSKQYSSPTDQTAIIVANNAASACVVGWVMYGVDD